MGRGVSATQLIAYDFVQGPASSVFMLSEFIAERIAAEDDAAAGREARACASE